MRTPGRPERSQCSGYLPLGAGIIANRRILDSLGSNADYCLREFANIVGGGDGRISACTGDLLALAPLEAIDIRDSLHQMDFQDVSGLLALRAEGLSLI